MSVLTDGMSPDFARYRKGPYAAESVHLDIDCVMRDAFTPERPAFVVQINKPKPREFAA